MRPCSWKSVVLCGLLCGAAAALEPTASVTGWRGDGTGRYPNATPPTEWAGRSDTQPDGRNILWATSMPDWSNASPILVAGKLFVQSEPTSLLCVDAADGKVLWTRPNDYSQVMTAEEVAKAELAKGPAAEIRQQIASVQKAVQERRARLQTLAARTTQPAEPLELEKIRAEQEQVKLEIDKLQKDVDALKARLAPLTRWDLPPTNETNGYSSPTPASDGRHVYCLFGNGVAACYDLDGNRKWIRFVAKSTIEDGLSSSPVLADGKLLVHPDLLTGLDPATGQTVWTAGKTEASYGTPFITTLGTTTVAVTCKGDVVRVADGVVLARKVGSVYYCSPVVENSVVYFVQNISKAHGGGQVVRLSEPVGDVVKAEGLWQTTSARDRYYASPVVLDGLAYVVTQAKVFSVIDAADGRVVKELQLILGKGTTFPSICLAGGLLFVSHDSGQTAVIRPGRDAEVTRVNTLEPFRTTPLFVGDRIYIRTLKNLYCLGRKG